MTRLKRAVVCVATISGMPTAQAQLRLEGRELSNSDNRFSLLLQAVRATSDQQRAANPLKKRDPNIHDGLHRPVRNFLNGYSALFGCGARQIEFQLPPGTTIKDEYR